MIPLDLEKEEGKKNSENSFRRESIFKQAFFLPPSGFFGDANGACITLDLIFQKVIVNYKWLN